MKVLIAIAFILLALIIPHWQYTDIGCQEVRLTGDGPQVHVLIQDNGGNSLYQGTFPGHYFASGATIPLLQAHTAFFVITVYHTEGARIQYFMYRVWEQCGLVK